MDEDHNPIEEDDNEQLSERDIAQVYECDERADDHYASDDDDEMPGSSNASAMNDEVIDDSTTALQAHSQDCFCIAVAANRWLATGGEDDVAFIFDQTKSDSEPVHKIQHEDSVVNVSFNSSETLLASGDMSGKIIVTHIPSLATRCEVNDCNDLEWMTWHTTTDILFAGDKDGMVWMWLVGPKGVAQSKVYAGSGAACTIGILLPDAKRMLAGYADGSLRLWQLKEQTSTQLNFNAAITAIQHHPILHVAVIGTQKGFVYVVNTDKADKLQRASEIPPLNDTQAFDDEDEVDQCVECLSFSSSHPWFAVGRNDGSVCVYETSSSSPRSIFRSPVNEAITRCVWAMEGTVPLLVVGSHDGFVRVFDSRDGSLFKQIGNGGDPVLDLVVLDINPLRLLTAGAGGIVRMFDLSMF